MVLIAEYISIISGSDRDIVHYHSFCCCCSYGSHRYIVLKPESYAKLAEFSAGNARREKRK